MNIEFDFENVSKPCHVYMEFLTRNSCLVQFSQNMVTVDTGDKRLQNTVFVIYVVC